MHLHTGGAMSEGKKKNKWAKVLDEAGLLEDIEEGWSIPGSPVAGSTITVKSSGSDAIPTTVAPPKHKVKHKDREVVTDSRQPAMVEVGAPAVAASRRISQPYIDVSSAKETKMGLSDVNPIPAFPCEGKGKLMEASVAARGSDPVRAARNWEGISNVGSARISVIPEAGEPIMSGRPESIVDEPATDERPPLASDAPSAVDLRGEMSERSEVGDYSGALDLAERILVEFPDDAAVLRARTGCRDVLIKMYESRIGSFDRVPKAVVSDREIIWRNLDSAAGFILSRIDGMISFEDIMDISGLPRFETCRILSRLLQDGIIS